MITRSLQTVSYTHLDVYKRQDGYTSVDIGTYDNGDQSTTVIYTSDSYDVSGLVSLLGGAATADRSDIDLSLIHI